MPEDDDPGVSTIEMHEEFIQHMESGGRKITLLAVVATVAGAYFAANYFVQLVVFPYVFGITSQTVNLVDPGLVAIGALSLAVSLLWLYAGIRDIMFGMKISKQIREIRTMQARAAKKYRLGSEDA